jgi:pimeloyl-ACP methyl ester carboxylesterase
MPQITANGIQLHYETHGNPADPPLLLIMGLGAQLTLWPVELIEALVARGYHVIRHDNRDIGLSTKFTAAGTPNIAALVAKLMLGVTPKLPYTLTDMANDAAALLDALDIEAAHVVGASMGGMIAQLMAVHHPDRVRTLTSVMSTTGNRALPSARPEASAALMMRPPANAGLDDVMRIGIASARAIGSPGFPASEERLRARFTRDFHRSFHPTGAARQFAAIVADGDRRDRLAAITLPTLVIHGIDDPLVPVEGGRDTAAAIEGARLLEIAGMGHDLPLELVDTLADAIADHAQTATMPVG